MRADGAREFARDVRPPLPLVRHVANVALPKRLSRKNGRKTARPARDGVVAAVSYGAWCSGLSTP